MKKTLTVFTLVSAALFSSAVYSADVQNSIEEKTGVYKPETYAIRKAVKLHNDHGFFSVKALLTKPDANFNIKRSLILDCGTFGFSPAVDFLTFEVNGIRDSKLSLKASDLKLWQEGDRKGGELNYNFNGAELKLIFFMRPDSPVLWFKVMPGKKETPFEKIKINVSCLVSTIQKVDGKVAFQGGYHRKAKTETRLLEQQKAPIALTPEDKTLILYDEVCDGTSKEKGFGPVLIVPGKETVKSAILKMDDYWVTSLCVELPVDFKEYTFGIWQPRQGLSNKAFFEKVEKEKKAFTLPE